MNSVRIVSIACVSLLILGLTIAVIHGLWAQEEQAVAAEDNVLISAAREVMASAYYCALITVDQTGQPHARTMEPFPPEEDMVVWLGTDPKSRKVRQIQNDSRVALYYFDREGFGYVAITGTARLVDDPEEKAKRWQVGWDSYFKDRKENYLLIEVTPKTLDILSGKHGIDGDPETWRTPSVEFAGAALNEPEDETSIARPARRALRTWGHAKAVQ